jgi:hypothetical protein
MNKNGKLLNAKSTFADYGVVTVAGYCLYIDLIYKQMDHYIILRI